MYNQQYYIVVRSGGNRHVFGPLNSGAVGKYQHDLKRRFLRDGDDMMVMSESEYMENDRDDIINNTGATD
jgi:hypothetical protein